MITEDKDANTVNKQDKTSKQAAGGGGFFLDARDQTVSVAVSKIPRIDTPLHSASKLTTGQTSGNKPKSPKIVEDNVSDKANPSAVVENNIQ